jgi:hypothetical protein
MVVADDRAWFVNQPTAIRAQQPAEGDILVRRSVLLPEHQTAYLGHVEQEVAAGQEVRIENPLVALVLTKVQGFPSLRPGVRSKLNLATTSGCGTGREQGPQQDCQPVRMGITVGVQKRKTFGAAFGESDVARTAKPSGLRDHLVDL